MIKYIISFVLFYYSFNVNGQNLELLSKLPDLLKGCSGVELTTDGNLLMINDHGNPFIYFIDTSSYVIKKTIYLNNKIKDWEDLTIDNNNNLYVGDFGNNRNNRKDLKIYKVSNISDSSKQIITADIIRFSLPDQKEFPPGLKKLEFDIEAMAHVDEHLFLFTKSRGKPFRGLVKLYMLPDVPGEYTAQLLDSTFLGNGVMWESWITSADILNNQLVLLTHGRIFLYSCFENNDFFLTEPTVIDLHNFSQKESICFNRNSQSLIITDELFEDVLGGNIYTIKIPPSVSIPCNE